MVCFRDVCTLESDLNITNSQNEVSCGSGGKCVTNNNHYNN